MRILLIIFGLLTSSLVQDVTSKTKKLVDKNFEDFQLSQWYSYATNIITKGFTKFTLDLDQAFERTKPFNVENIIFSPASLTSTLTSLLLFTNVTTFLEITKILGLDSGLDINHNSEVVHRIVGLLLEDYKKEQADQGVPVYDSSTAIFIENGWPFPGRFTPVIEDIYGSLVKNVDFFVNDTATQKMIENWIREKMMDKILSVPLEPISWRHRIRIATVAHFHGLLRDTFFAETLKNKTFNVDDSELVSVEMMVQFVSGRLYQDSQLGFEMIEMPFRTKSFHEKPEVFMYVAMAHADGRTGLKNLKRRLTPEIIDKSIANMTNRDLGVMMPKMTNIAYSLSPKQALIDMGLKSLFFVDFLRLLTKYNSHDPTTSQPTNNIPDDAAAKVEEEYVRFLKSQNLTKFNIDKLRLTDTSFDIDDFVHVTKLVIPSEAKNINNLNSNRSPYTFRVDKPYLMFIRHNVTKSILFWASVNNPNQLDNKMIDSVVK
ncbi:hypothetical protein QAD02_000865 [Eretmocerus hayati]|uniref:Uncharacterized protein n=1 Tax=Eretmocerus hayati TaxID=131215 RepID=A0ACC2NET6_9HYME|nr:hypothetical protein QAD02_000865 [Eretmocerus hayati]